MEKTVDSYVDYLAVDDCGALLSPAIQCGKHNAGGYLCCIAIREQVERLGDHDLFGDAEHVNLTDAMPEISPKTLLAAAHLSRSTY